VQMTLQSSLTAMPSICSVCAPPSDGLLTIL
jgi:hypothetical protein